jgi:hypothetical protein
MHTIRTSSSDPIDTQRPQGLPSCICTLVDAMPEIADNARQKLVSLDRRVANYNANSIDEDLIPLVKRKRQTLPFAEH